MYSTNMKYKKEKVITKQAYTMGTMLVTMLVIVLIKSRQQIQNEKAASSSFYCRRGVIVLIKRVDSRYRMKKQLYLVFIAEGDIRSTNPHLTPGQESDPSASPTKLARATISRTVVVLKMTKMTKKGRPLSPKLVKIVAVKNK